MNKVAIDELITIAMGANKNKENKGHKQHSSCLCIIEKKKNYS